MAEKIKERKREENWSSAEKECLRELISCHKQIIDNKSNDASMITLKKDAWSVIRRDMLECGFDRDVKRMKQQWMRMKIGARKGIAVIRKTNVVTGNLVIRQRQEQISAEASQNNELHMLKMEQLRAEIAHQSRMHRRQEEQLEELHALKCQLLREQIEQQKYPNDHNLSLEEQKYHVDHQLTLEEQKCHSDQNFAYKISPSSVHNF